MIQSISWHTCTRFHSPYYSGIVYTAILNEEHSNTGWPKKIAKFQINNLSLHLQEVEKQQQQQKPRVNRRKEMFKIKEGINDIETKKTIQRTNQSSSWYFVKINKIDKPLSRLERKKERGPK